MSLIIAVVNQMPKFVVELKEFRVSELNTLTILQCSATDSVIIVKYPQPHNDNFCHTSLVFQAEYIVGYSVQLASHSISRTNWFGIKVLVNSIIWHQGRPIAALLDERDGEDTMLVKSNNGLEDTEATVQDNIPATAMDGLGEAEKKASLAKLDEHGRRKLLRVILPFHQLKFK